MSSLVKADVVLFSEVRKSYLPGEKLEVSYTIQDNLDLKPASRDWVGLFRVGWASSRDYYTFEWVQLVGEDNKGAVSFAGRRLPPEDKHFYQFCYVSSAGRVRGASSPFQFSSVPVITTSVDDLELVEVSEDSLMVLQPREKVMTATNVNVENVSGLIENNASENENVSLVEVNDESLTSKFEIVEREVVEKGDLLDGMEKKMMDMETKMMDMETKMMDMEAQLQAKRESEMRLMEKLEKEKARCHMLEAADSREEAERMVLTHKLEDYESQITNLQEKNENLIWENGKLKETVSSLGADLEKSKQNLRELQDVEVELMTQIGEKNRELKDLNIQAKRINLELSSKVDALNQEKHQVSEELGFAQQNIAELVGARKYDLVVNTSICASNKEGDAIDNETPPTLPAPHDDMVDRSVYEALQQAYDNVEQYHHKATDDNKGLIASLHVMKNKLEVSLLRNKEYVHRIDQCRHEYETKVKEVMELKSKVKVGVMAGNKTEIHDELTSLRAQLRDMQENQEQVGKSWEEAIKELTVRKEELKEKAMQLAEMDNKVVTLQEELHMLRNEFGDFQDRHDKTCHDKTEKIGEQQHLLQTKVHELAELRSVIAGSEKEKAKLEDTVKKLRSQLDTLKMSVKTTEERECPVCHTKFPKRVPQLEFEHHVQAHFP